MYPSLELAIEKAKLIAKKESRNADIVAGEMNKKGEDFCYR